jgi:ElaB/YqjD/DUF883 family membrane-anchored ribosome-binding protein
MAERTAELDGPLVDGARRVEATAGRIKETIVTGTQDGLAKSRQYVCENPMRSVLVGVGVGVGVGALIGYLIGRRSA